MNLVDVAAELAARLRTIPGFTGGVYAHPVDTVVPPAAIVVYPDSIDYDLTYARGADKLTIPVVVVVGRAKEAKATMAALSGYWSGSGDRSVKAALEADGAGVEGVLDFVSVISAEAGDITIGGVGLVAAEFTVEVVGSGA